MREEVEKVINGEIRPGLQADGGDVEILDINEESGTVTVRLKGHCAGCPMSMMTLKGFIERVLTERVPGVKAVIAQP